MGFSLTDMLYFGGADPTTVTSGSLRIFNRRILEWIATGHAVEVVVRGVPPLVLVNAIEDGLVSLKAFGGTEHVPQTYLSSVVLDGGTEQGLPDGYTALTFVENTSGTYIDLGVPFNDADSVLEVTMTAVNNTNYVASARDGNTMQGIAGSSTTFKAYIDPVSLTSTTTKTAGHKYKFTFTANNGNATFKTEDLTAETSDTQTTVYTVSQTQPTAHLGLFGNSYGNVMDAGADFYGLKYTVAGEVVLNLIPCRHGATIGVFDLVSRQFLTATQGSLMAGLDTTLAPTPDAPIDIWCNNGVLKARHQSGLPLGYTLLDYIESTGTQYIDTGYAPNINSQMFLEFTATTISSTDSYILHSASGQDRISLAMQQHKAFFGSLNSQALDSTTLPTFVANSDYNIIFNKEKVTLNGTDYTFSHSSVTLQDPMGNLGIFGSVSGALLTPAKLKRLTISENSVLVRNFIPAKRHSDNAIGMYDLVSGQFFTNAGTGDFVAGSAVSDPVEVYADGTQETVTDALGNVANCENLLSVGTYKDTQELLTGAITRNVGIKVLDGTEGWVQSGTKNDVYRLTETTAKREQMAIYATHFVGTREADVNMPDNSIKLGSYASIPDYGVLAIRLSNVTTLSQFQQFLADQYAAGTPVIIVYQLDTPTTESVSPQVLTTEPITQTAGSISGLGITATESTATVPTPSRPLDIRCNNGVLKVSSETSGKNAIDTSDIVAGYISPTAIGAPIAITESLATNTVKKAIRCEINKQYRFRYISSIVGQRSIIIADDNGNALTNSQPLYCDLGLNEFTITATATGWYWLGIQSGDLATVQPEIYEIGQIYADGTVETIQVTGKNLFTGQEDITLDYYLDNNGVATSSYGMAYTNGYTEVNGGTYTFSGFDYAALQSANFSAVCYDENKNVLGRVGRREFFKDYSTFTTLPNTKYLRFNIPVNTTSTSPLQLELGSTATDYEPYYNGGTATAETLLKAGNADEQEIIDGTVTRKAGTLVLDGSEAWLLIGGSTNRVQLYIPDSLGDNTKPVYCSHFKYDAGAITGDTCRISVGKFLVVNLSTSTTVNAFKQWLADQYTAGTPVIVVYSLETETTESVAGQALQVTDGDNVVDITQASMSGLELEVTYKAGVVLTIEEVEDAQLSNDVVVTIE